MGFTGETISDVSALVVVSYRNRGDRQHKNTLFFFVGSRTRRMIVSSASASLILFCLSDGVFLLSGLFFRRVWWIA